jgi:acetyltransferase-like isoleucine patch superfamily enzyme
VASIIEKLLHAASRVGWVRRLRRRARFPGLGMATTVNLSVQGTLTYGRSCSIGEGANVLIPYGATLQLGDGCYVGRYVEIGPSGTIAIGAHSSLQDRTILLGDVSVGKHCIFAPNVFISSGRHYFDLHPGWLIQDQDEFVRRNTELSLRHSRPVVVEDDCWIGINAVVMPGVTIGKGAVVGAGSVVARDVAPYTVVGGAPARVLKQRLVFAPPSRIRHDNEQDWPYFYRGFEMSQRSLDRNAVHGGIAARDEFVICLDGAAARALHLVAKSVGGGQCMLGMGGVTRAVAGDFTEIVFERSIAGGFEPFARIRATPASATVIVREAWVQ